MRSVSPPCASRIQRTVMSTSRLRAPALSRRSFIQLSGLAGGAVLLGATAACAGPTGKPSSDTLVLALNRSLVSLDNKLNQFDAAVTAQRGVRQALTRIGNDGRRVER